MFFFLVIVVALGLNFVLLQRAKQNLGDGPSDPSTRRVAAHATIHSPRSPEQLRPVVEAALVAAGATLKGSTPTRVCATTGFSMRSYGQVLTVWFRPGEGSTQLFVESKPLSTLTRWDFGASKKSLDRALESLTSAGVQSSGSEF